MKHYSKKGIIFLCSLVYFTSYFTRKSFSVASVEIIQSGFLDKSVAGLIGTAMFTMYGVGQIISGLLSDRISPKLLITSGLITTCICNALMSIIKIPYLMVPIWGINGLAQAMLWPPIVRILSRYLNNDEYVKANFIVCSAAHISTILLYFYVPMCLYISNWKAVFIGASILSAVMCLALIVGLSIILPNEPSVTTESPATQKPTSNSGSDIGLIRVALTAGILPIFFVAICNGFLRDGIESWLPTLYSEAFKQNASSSILVSVILPVFSILSSAIVTRLHRKAFKNETYGSGILFALAVVLTVPLFILIERNTTVCRIICLILVAFISGCMHAINFLLSCLPARFARYNRAASVCGILNASVYIGAAISNYGIALIAEHMGWKANIFTWGCVALLGLIFALLSMHKYTKFIKQD